MKKGVRIRSSRYNSMINSFQDEKLQTALGGKDGQLGLDRVGGVWDAYKADHPEPIGRHCFELHPKEHPRLCMFFSSGRAL